MGTYEPRPIDTAKVKLSAELQELTEQLAENAHDNWARRRLSEGWTWGARRDDAAKKHPDLVPYGELSEAEKHYDRDTAMETLRAIIALGYRIERD
jgi:RyR domain